MDRPSWKKKAVWLVPTFSLLGGFLAVWLAPKVIAWYFDPPAQFGFNCRAPIEWALAKMQYSLLAGILAGAVLGIVLASVWFAHQKRQVPPPSING